MQEVYYIFHRTNIHDAFALHSVSQKAIFFKPLVKINQANPYKPDERKRTLVLVTFESEREVHPGHEIAI